MNDKRWVAIAADGEILSFGITQHWQRFDRRIFKMAAGTYFKWVAEGARYCELKVPSWSGLVGFLFTPKPGLYISDYPHGRIRKCKSVPK